MTKEASDLISEATAQETLDGYMKRDPAGIMDEEIEKELVPALRRLRASFISAKETRKSKKEEKDG